MAKKKKQTKPRKKAETETNKKSAFWPLAGAILMIVLAVFLLLGGFGTGGSLPKSLFQGAYWALGWAAYLTPLALVFFGIHKFISEDRNIPLDKLVGMLGFLLVVSNWFHVTFASKNGNQITGGHGGQVGALTGNLVLQALDKIPASLLFFVLTVLLFFLTFGISPKVIMKLLDMLKSTREPDTDLADLKAKAGGDNGGFKLNEGVPVEHGDNARLSSFRNTAQKLAATENHEALTTASDPDWKFPTVDLLNQKQDKANAGDVEANADIIRETFDNFNYKVEMEGANVGPRVTQYTIKPPAGVKLTKIAALDKNLELDLAAESIRIEAPIPGKKAVGIEVPNVKPATVRLASIFASDDWEERTDPLEIAIGKDIAGKPVMASLDKMPHLLVAGQTNSGKSVMINSILTSLLFRNSPSDLKLILVDPKHVELAPYNDIPHLLTEVINEPEKCISALKWAVAEMERRYRTLAEAKSRNIHEYNQKKQDEGMPFIVIVIDELADLMMMAARDVEALIVRIAQKARAVGIHLVIATQRPSVDVITGLIKANVPARIAFTTTSQVDSRTIIDQIGAEKLLGMGDMLFSKADMPKPKRVQGALIETSEIQKVTDFLRMQRGPNYDDEIISQPVQLNGRGGIVAEIDSSDEPIFRDAVKVVVDARKASTSLLQRRLRIGYGKAARLIENMEEQGIVGPADGSRPREVLVSSVDEVFGGGTSQDEPEDDVYSDMPDEEETEES
ncbi:MAG TPA: DNA translocase FtsK 4TM domain-containing protein [Candidatus Saccharimonadales bacterium]|nr:DNA translocase FtsK 4TM domain-containing protein [Candidatus Saccharimonadales bacterium]